MQTFSHWVLGHKRLVVLVWLAATLAGLVATARVGDRLTGQLDQPGRPGYETNQQIIREYGNGGDQYPLILVLTAPAGSRVAAPTLSQALEPLAHQGFRVASYANTGDARLLAADGRTTAVLVYAPGKRVRTVHVTLPPGWTQQVTGVEALENGGGVDVLVETLIAAAAALVVLVLVFGSVLAVVPLLIAFVSVLTAFLALYGLTEITSISAIVQFIVALIGLGVAIDYSLLLITRWREERATGATGAEAVHRAMATAGRSVLLSGVGVAIGLCAMIFLPVPFLRGVGYGGMLIPVVSVLAVLTLLPVLLATLGPRLDRRPLKVHGGRWVGWTRLVVRWRWLAALASLGVLAALATAALGLRLGDPVTASLASSGPAYQARATLLSAGLPAGLFTPVEVLTAPDTTVPRVDGVATVLAPAGWGRLVDVIPEQETSTDPGRATVAALRAAAPAGVRVGGAQAQTMDFVESVYGAFPFVLGAVALVTFVLLARGFRSVVLAAKAVVLNLLSLAAILGAVVLVWQDGYGSRPLWSIAATGTVTEFLPVMVFAFLYGLSMDYEVFILSRVREEYDRTGDTRTAVVEGVGRTGRLVTSAALILFLAFACLASAPQTEIKVFATGLGLGILLDATIIRALLVPALVAILGQWNWWMPGWVARLLRVPRVSVANGIMRVPVRTRGEP